MTPPYAVARVPLGADHLQRALGKGTLFHLNPQGHLPPQVEVGSYLGLGVARLVVSLLVQPLSKQYKLGEIGFANRAAPYRGRYPVERVPAYKV